MYSLTYLFFRSIPRELILCEVESRNTDRTGLRTDAFEIRDLGGEKEKNIGYFQFTTFKIL